MYSDRPGLHVPPAITVTVIGIGIEDEDDDNNGYCLLNVNQM